MKNGIILLLTFVLASCKFPSTKTSNTPNNTFATNTYSTVATANDSPPEEEYADYFLVILNSSKQYETLHQNMLAVHKRFHIAIDTLGRYYDFQTHKIILPEDDADEMYQGAYFPRRFESLSLSIENADYFDDSIELREPAVYPVRMILVAGMFADKHRADSLQKILQSSYPDVFVQKSKSYIGCMH